MNIALRAIWLRLVLAVITFQADQAESAAHRAAHEHATCADKCDELRGRAVHLSLQLSNLGRY